MWATIGNVKGGEFAGSVLALDYEDVEPDEFAEFACWTPHRYVLSVERNIVPRDLALDTRAELVNQTEGREADALAEAFFGQDYIHVISGPHEGSLLTVPPLGDGVSATERETIRLAAGTPMMRAMADPGLLAADLRAQLEGLSHEKTDDRAAFRVLKYCASTVDWTVDVPSPDMALRMWMAEVYHSWKSGKRDARSACIRDAQMMARAVVGHEQLWVSGDWGQTLSDIVATTISWLIHRGTIG